MSASIQKQKDDISAAVPQRHMFSDPLQVQLTSLFTGCLKVDEHRRWSTANACTKLAVFITKQAWDNII